MKTIATKKTANRALMPYETPAADVFSLSVERNILVGSGPGEQEQPGGEPGED